MNEEHGKSYLTLLIESCANSIPLKTAIVHPVHGNCIEVASEALSRNLIDPVLIGPKTRILEAAASVNIDISAWQIIDVEHSHAAAKKASDMAGSHEVKAIMKGSLHTDEVLHAIILNSALRTERRLSHAYVFETSAYSKPFIVSDSAVNIAPGLEEKVDICQNAINLWRALNGDRICKLAILSTVETVNAHIPSTIDAAALCKMAERGQITGAIIDGPLAFDNAASRSAADEKGIVSRVSGDADIFIAPNLEAANMFSKELIYWGGAEAAGIVLGSRVPIILTSRADSNITKLASCALAVKLSQARETGLIK